MINDIPDHPIVRNLEATGYPDGKDFDFPFQCEVCGRGLYGDDYKFGGEVVCEYCYEKANDLDTVISFIKSEQTVTHLKNDFFNFLHDSLWGAGECGDEVIKILKEYRDFKEREFEEWFVD